MFKINNFSFQAALFDLDGVVINTESQYSIFWQQIFQDYYPETSGLEDQIKGQTLVQIFNKYFSNKEKEQNKIIERLDDYERHMQYDYIPYFTEFIHRLKEKSVKTAVVTSSNQAKMENVYRNHSEFTTLFDKILTSEDFSNSKPDPDCYLKAAESLQIPTSLCVGFEDSFNGLKSVRAAGMKVVGVATTNSAEEISMLSDIVINDYSDKNLRF